MGLIRSLRRRFGDEFHADERELNKRRRALAADLAAKAKDAGLAAFLRDLVRALDAAEQAFRFRAYLGRALSRALVHQAPVYAAIEKRYAGEPGRLDFGGIVLARPLNFHDKRWFAEMFFDFLLKHLFERAGEPFASGFLSEEPYDLDRRLSLDPGAVVLDCGANMGLFAAMAAAKGCTVHAFEPARYILENYLEKAAAWNRGVEVCPYALSDRPGALAFAVNSQNIGGSARANAGDKRVESVRAVRLDDYVAEKGLDRVDFIKADIEGAERDMLRGAVETIRRFSPKLAIDRKSVV